MGRKKAPQQELEQHSRNRLGLLLSDWIVNSHDAEDFGYDFEIRPTEEGDGFLSISPQNFYLQLKATESFDDDDQITVTLPVGVITDDWLKASIPVVLAIYGRESDGFYWCIMQDYCWDVLDDKHAGWRDQKYISIKVNRSMGNQLSQRRFLTSSLSSTQERIAFRQHIATISDSRNSEFSWEFKADLASVDDIAEHKLDRVDLARVAIRNGATAVGLSTLLEVYNLPEDDEAKLEAIISLLENRDLGHPVVAVLQNRFAREGMEIARNLGRDEVNPRLDNYRERSLKYMRTYFDGALFHDTEINQDVRILKIDNFSPDEGRPMWVALMQYETGQYYDESAGAIGPPEFELKELGDGQNPLSQACDEDEHSFDAEVITDLEVRDICDNCGLSAEVLWELTGQRLFRSVGDRCVECDTRIPASAKEGESFFFGGDYRICPDCWQDYNSRFGVRTESIGTTFQITCYNCDDWSNDEDPGADACPNCGAEQLIVDRKQQFHSQS